MGVTQGHSHVAVPEQSRDDRHRDAIHHGVACQVVTKLMETAIFHSGFAAHRKPQGSLASARAADVAWRRKDKLALSTRLAVNDAPGLRVQWNRSRTGLAVAKGQRVAPHLRTSQRQNLALAASGEQKQPDDVRLLSGARALAGAFVERVMQAPEFVVRQEPREGGAPVERDGVGGAEYGPRPCAGARSSRPRWGAPGPRGRGRGSPRPFTRARAVAGGRCLRRSVACVQCRPPLSPPAPRRRSRPPRAPLHRQDACTCRQARASRPHVDRRPTRVFERARCPRLQGASRPHVGRGPTRVFERARCPRSQGNAVAHGGFAGSAGMVRIAVREDGPGGASPRRRGISGSARGARR